LRTKRLPLYRSLEERSPTAEGATLVATAPPWNFYVYKTSYVDDTGATQNMLPDYTVIGGSAAIEGTRAFGAIRDEAAGYQAVPFHSKSWTTEDPSVRFLLLQSAPLIIPLRPNASFCGTIN
jgi:hypothetical protein